MSDLIGKNLGKYQIIVRLGRGGMARVYKAYQPGLDRYVAVKVLHHHLAEENGFVNRFEREATAVARLRHPNIVQVYDFDTEGNQYYMVMEYVEGPTLKAELEERQKVGEPAGQEFSLEQIATIFSALSDAIDYAHSRGMLHRDLKPANIMFTQAGEVMLTDFGLSRMMDGTRYTQTGSISGTPAYMSPEQCQGEQGDERSDIYSLGVMLYEMITGRVPFDADRPYVLMMKHITDPVTAPSEYKPDLPPAVEQVIFKSLAKEPTERYQTAGEMAAALRQAVGLTARPVKGSTGTFAPIAGIPLTSESTPTPGREAGDHPPSSTRLIVDSPYRGLYAFREEDAPFFFGREAFTDRLFQTIQQQAMAAVLGPSGSGKSSVIYAGLIPRLRQEGHWTIIEMRPGSRPFYALAAALIPYLEPDLSETDQLVEAQKLAEALRLGQVELADVAQRILQKRPDVGRLLLFIDQFEELYTLCPDPDVRGRFPNTLFQAVQPNDESDGSDSSPILQPSSFCLVLTLRADFMGQALTDRPFADALQDADVKLGPMTRAELARAIESPAGKQGVIFEAGLAERILDDVGNEPGNLPLLEFALTLLWDRRAGRRMTHAAYEAIGRVEGSLARYADEIFESLTEADQERARRVFTQMVRPGEGTEDTRRLATRTELGENDWALARRLADARLLVTGRTPEGEETAEVVHEALIRGWGRLRQWMSRDRAFRGWQERVRAAMRQWEASQRDEGALLRGAPLSEAEDWMIRQGYDLTKLEREFVNASISLRERHAAEQEAQRQRELAAAHQLAEEQERRAKAERRRADEQAASSQRLRALTSVLAVVFVIAVFAAIFALGQRQDAVAAQQAAEQEADARATEVLVRSTAEANAQQSASLAITREAEALDAQATAEAERIRADQQAEQALAAQAEAIVERDRADAEAQLALSRQLAVQSSTFLGSQFDLALLTALQANAISDTVETRSSILTALEFNPQVYTYLRGHSSLVQGIAFSPDSSQIASVGANGEVRLWDVASRQLLPQTFTGHDDTQLVNSVAFSPDGTILATASDDTTAILWDVATGEILHTLTGHSEFIQDIAYSPDGTLVATAAGDNTVRLWNPANGQEVAVLEGHVNQVWSVAFSPDSLILASGSASTASTGAIVRLWDVPTRQLIGELDLGPNGLIYNLNFSPDGQTLAATSPNPPTVRFWNVASRTEIGQPLAGHAFGVLGLAFSPDGQQIATSSIDTSVRLWDVGPLLAGETEQAPAGNILNGHQTTIPGLAYSPDGQFLATGEGNGRIIVWDVGVRHWLTEELPPSHQLGINLLAFNPADQSLASAGTDGRVLSWHLGANPVITTSLTHTADVTRAVTSLAFDTTGQFLATGQANGNITAWNVITGQTVISPLLSHLQGSVVVALSPDGQTFASGTINGNIILRAAQGFVPLGGFLAGQGGPINALAFSPDSQILASAGEDGTVRLWNSSTSDPLAILSHEDSAVESLAFAPEGNWLASADRAGIIRLWDWTSGEPISQPLQLHNQPVLTLRFTDDGQRLFSADPTGVIVEWDLTNSIALEGLVEVGPNVTRLIYTLNGEQLIAGYADGTITIWDVASNEAVLSLTGHNSAISSLALSNDGTTLASGDEAGRTIVWNVNSGQMINAPLAAEPAVLNVIDMSYSADGRYLATAGSDSSILVWDTATSSPIGPPIFNGYAGIGDLELSQDGQTLALGSCGHFEVRLGCNLGRIYLWDTASGRLLATVEGHISNVNSLAFSPDGRHLVSGGCSNADIAGTCIRGNVMLWDLSTTPPTGQQLRDFSFPIFQVLYSPDGNLLLAAGGNAITLLDPATGQPIGQSLSGHTAGINTATFSPDGRLLASGSCANFNPATGCTLGEIILWDVASGQPIGAPFLGHAAAITSLVFTPDGQTLISSAADATIIQWDMDFDAWKEQACRMANRNLSPSEWEAFFSDEPYQPTCP